MVKIRYLVCSKMTADEYRELNTTFGRPFRYDLTTARGFFSVVNCLINAATYGLIKRRQLVVSEADFDGLSWSDFFDFKWPDETEAHPLELAVLKRLRDEARALVSAVTDTWFIREHPEDTAFAGETSYRSGSPASTNRSP